MDTSHPIRSRVQPIAFDQTGSKQIRNSLSPTNRTDLFKFTLKARSSFSAVLNGLQGNVDLALLRGNKVIAQSHHPGRRNESVNQTLAAGTYFLRVANHGGRTRYQLHVATAEDSSTPPVQSQVFYSDEFGYESLPTTMDGLHFLEASGVTAFFGDSPDLSSFLNAVYTQFGDAETAYASQLIVQQVSSLNAFEPSMGRPDRLFVNSRGETNFVPGAPGFLDGSQPPMETVYYPEY